MEMEERLNEILKCLKDSRESTTGLVQELKHSIGDILSQNGSVIFTIKNSISEHNKECRKEMCNLIDERIEAFKKTDHTLLKRDVLAVVDRLFDIDNLMSEVDDKLEETMTTENGNKTAHKIEGIKGRLNRIQLDIIARFDGQTIDGKFIPGINSVIAESNNKIDKINKKMIDRETTMKYVVDIIVKLIPILISITALVFTYIKLIGE